MNLLYFWTGGGIAWAGGSTATIGVNAVSGTFAAGWTGAGAPGLVGVQVVSIDTWITRQRWDGSIAVIGVGAIGGSFSGIGRAHGKTGMTVLGRTKTDTRVHQSRTAMMVGTGRARTGGR